MQKLVVLIVTSLFFIASVSQAHKKKHREHGSHQHGKAHLTVAFDGLKGQVEFKGASEGIVGFEHIAKTEADKKKWQMAADSFEKNISTYVGIDPTAKCTFSKQSIDMVRENSDSNHSDFVALFNIGCEKSILGSKLTFDFSTLNKLKAVDVTVLADQLQLKAEVKSKPVTLELK